MSDAIRLTVAEWRQRFARRDADVEFADTAGMNVDGDLYLAFSRSVRSIAVRGDLLAPIMTFANAALPDGHPLKITREDVAALHVVLSGYGSEFVEDGKGDVARCERLAAKLAALLPPEG